MGGLEDIDLAVYLQSLMLGDNGVYCTISLLGMFENFQNKK